MNKKQELQLKKEELIRLVSSFCKAKLNDEYEQLCIKMIQKLYIKENCPFRRGSLNIWAASIVYTIGSMNYLFDNFFELHIHSSEIHKFFRTRSSTVCAKSSIISDLLDLAPFFDYGFSTECMNEQNPFAEFVEIDGSLFSVESLPEEYQQMVKEARKNGEDIVFETEK